MATQRDYYEVLGVPRDAADGDVKKAYRDLARRLHPDVVGDGEKAAAEVRFKEINEAYVVLSDPQKRSQYDRFGTVDARAGFGGFPFGESGFGDIFDAFFGGSAQRRAGPSRGADLRYDLTLELEDALRGAERQISYRHLGRCDACNGTGSADAAAAPVQCAECRGSGQVRTARNTLLGQFVTTSTCPRCGGDGTIVKNACKVCRGRGRCELERSVSVKIPAGVEDGMQLRHAGMGEAGERGGQPGDLYVFVSVRPNGVFEREGPNLRCDTEVSFTQAALGARLEIDGLDGPVRIDIPAGAQNGSVFRIGGRGLPRLRGSGRGDLFVEIRVRVPTKLTRKQRELLEAFAHAGGEDAEDKKSAKNVRGAFGN